MYVFTRTGCEVSKACDAHPGIYRDVPPHRKTDHHVASLHFVKQSLLHRLENNSQHAPNTADGFFLGNIPDFDDIRADNGACSPREQFRSEVGQFNLMTLC